MHFHNEKNLCASMIDNYSFSKLGIRSIIIPENVEIIRNYGFTLYIMISTFAGILMI